MIELAIYPDSDPSVVTGIGLLKDGTEYWIKVNVYNTVLAALNMTSAGAVPGTNDASPPNLSLNWEVRDWRL